MRNRDAYFWAALAFFALAMLGTYLGEVVIGHDWHLTLNFLRDAYLLIALAIAGWRFGFRAGLIAWVLMGLALTPHIIISLISWHEGMPAVIHYSSLIISGFPVLWFTNYVHKAVSTLQVSEEKYRTLIENTIDPIFMIDKDYRVLSVNGSAVRFLHKSPEEITGKTVYELFPEELARRYSQNLKRVFETGTSLVMEGNSIAGGRDIWLSTSLSPVKNLSGEVIAVIGMSKDLTGHREAENRLRESEELFSKAFHNSPLSMTIASFPDRRLLEVNDSFLRMLKYSREEVIGRTSTEINLVADPEAQSHILQLFQKEGRIRNYESIIRTKMGELRTVLFSCERIVIQGQDHVITMVTDITERKRTEEEIARLLDRESRAAREWQETFDAVTDVVTLISPDFELLRINKTLYEATGKKPEDLLGRKCYQVFHGTDAPIEECPCTEALRTKSFCTTELAQQGKHYLLSAYPIFNKEGEITSLTHIVSDITERKEAENRLTESEELFSKAFHHSPLSMTITSIPERRLLDVNDSFLRTLEYTREEVIGRTPTEINLVADPEAQAHMLQLFQKEGRIRNYETTVRTKTGKLHSVLFSGEKIVIQGREHVITMSTDITERKLAEEALLNISQTMNDFLESSPDGFCLFDEELNLVTINQAALDIYPPGTRREDVMGKNITELAPNVGETERYAMMQVLKTGIPLFDENTVTHPKFGERILNAKVFRTANGLGVIITDITERKKYLNLLQESEQKYRSLFEKMLNGYVYGRVFLDEENQPVDLTCLDVNPAFERITGLRREDVVGKRASQGTAGNRNLMPELLPLYRQVALTGGEVQLERYFNGLNLWLSLSVFSPLKDHFVIVFENITERKAREKELRESEASLREAQRIAHMGNWDWDIINDRVKWSEEVFRILDLDPQKAIPSYKEFLSHIHPEDRELIQRFTHEALRSQSPYDMDYRLIRPDSSERIVHQKYELITDDSGRLTRISGTLYDITERKQMEEKLANTERLASIGEMASGIVHELNNPLTSILGYSELIMKHNIPDAVKEDLLVMNMEAKRASQITKNLLRFARKYTPRKEKIDIHSIMEAVLELRAREHRVNNIEIVRRFSSRLPAIMADGFQLQQVFLNIVINAEYFMVEKNKRGTLIITTEPAGDTVRISFADDGPGIAPHNLKHLFDPFFTTKEAGKGTGLGLSICYGTIKEHGGRLLAESEPGKGATFTIELPANGNHREEIK